MTSTWRMQLLFSLFLPRAESHISSRLGMRGRRRGRKRLAFYANDEGYAVAACCTGDGGEVTNYSSLSAALVFKGRAFHLGNQAGAELEDPPGISRPSIHHINLRRQCLQHPFVTSSRISLVQSLGSLCQLRPKVYEAFTVSDSSSISLHRQSFSDEKKMLLEIVPG